MPVSAGPLLDQLRRDADARVTERTAQARADAEHIRDVAATQRAHRRAAAIAARERELAGQREAERNAAAQSTVHDVLAARGQFLERVFARTQTVLNAMPAAPGFERRLTPLLTDALRFVDAGEARVRCAADSQPAVRAILQTLGTASMPVVVDATVPAGAVVENATGTVRVDATFTALLQRVRPLAAIEAVRLAEQESA
jgi:vacuolar-type H+-ATPase subunit E/Vma4